MNGEGGPSGGILEDIGEPGAEGFCPLPGTKWIEPF